MGKINTVDDVGEDEHWLMLGKMNTMGDVGEAEYWGCCWGR